MEKLGDPELQRGVVSVVARQLHGHTTGSPNDAIQSYCSVADAVLYAAAHVISSLEADEGGDEEGDEDEDEDEEELPKKHGVEPGTSAPATSDGDATVHGLGRSLALLPMIQNRPQPLLIGFSC